MTSIPSIQIDSLNLDLRGVPHPVAKSVPPLIGPALERELSRTSLALDHSLSDLPPIRVNTPSNASPNAIAHEIARQIARHLSPRT